MGISRFGNGTLLSSGFSAITRNISLGCSFFVFGVIAQVQKLPNVLSILCRLFSCIEYSGQTEPVNPDESEPLIRPKLGQYQFYY